METKAHKHPQLNSSKFPAMPIAQKEVNLDLARSSEMNIAPARSKRLTRRRWQQQFEDDDDVHAA